MAFDIFQSKKRSIHHVNSQWGESWLVMTALMTIIFNYPDINHEINSFSFWKKLKKNLLISRIKVIKLQQLLLLLLLVMMMIFILFFEEERTERDIFSRFRFARRGPIGCCAPDRLPRVPQGFPLFKYRSSAENKTSETRIPLSGLPCFMNISSQWSECHLIGFWVPKYSPICMKFLMELQACVVDFLVNIWTRSQI